MSTLQTIYYYYLFIIIFFKQTLIWDWAPQYWNPIIAPGRNYKQNKSTKQRLNSRKLPRQRKKKNVMICIKMKEKKTNKWSNIFSAKKTRSASVKCSNLIMTHRIVLSEAYCFNLSVHSQDSIKSTIIYCSKSQLLSFISECKTAWVMKNKNNLLLKEQLKLDWDWQKKKKNINWVKKKKPF